MQWLVAELSPGQRARPISVHLYGFSCLQMVLQRGAVNSSTVSIVVAVPLQCMCNKPAATHHDAANPAAGNVQGDAWQANVQPEVGAVPLPDVTPPAAAAAAVLKPTDGQGDAPAVAAVLKPDLTAALDLHNTYRQRHQVTPVCSHCRLVVCMTKFTGLQSDGVAGFTTTCCRLPRALHSACVLSSRISWSTNIVITLSWYTLSCNAASYCVSLCAALRPLPWFGMTAWQLQRPSGLPAVPMGTQVTLALVKTWHVSVLGTALGLFDAPLCWA